MKNSLNCLDGIVNFEENVYIQTMSIVAFSEGQAINITQQPLSEGHTLSTQISVQLKNTRKIFQQLTILKIEEYKNKEFVFDAVEVIFNAINASGKSFYQVTWTILTDTSNIISFTSVYPDEKSMTEESGRLRKCVENFSPVNKVSD